MFLIVSAMLIDAILFGANLAVALAGGSRAVYSQAAYSLADMVGLSMLTWGHFVSRRPPDLGHPFGYGKERFFWAFSASLVTFSLAGFGVLLAGVEQAVAPMPVSDLPLDLTVVGVTLLASLGGMGIVLRELRREQRTIASFLSSAHQGMKTIFYQDVVSAAGGVVAFGGLLLVDRTGDATLDGLTAAAVGLMMLFTGVVLAAESRHLLVGQALSGEEAARILALVEGYPAVRKVRGAQSMLLGPEESLLALKVSFQDGYTTSELEREIERISGAIRREMPLIRHLIIEPSP